MDALDGLYLAMRAETHAFPIYSMGGRSSRYALRGQRESGHNGK